MSAQEQVKSEFSRTKDKENKDKGQEKSTSTKRKIEKALEGTI